MEKLSERIAWAISIIPADKDLDKGIVDVALAKVLGTNKDTLASYRKQKGLLKGEVIDKLVKHYKFNPMWFFLGQGEPFPGARAKYPEVCGPELSEFVTIPPQPDFHAEDFVFIRRVDGRISAGNGIIPDDTADVQCAFRRDWIKRKGGSPSRMSLISVSGDSMEPTLLSGDLVLVDHSRITVAPQGGIYAISLDQGIMIKRLQLLFPQNKVRILSDNQHYEPIDADPDHVKINGKVIWFGRDIER